MPFFLGGYISLKKRNEKDGRESRREMGCGVVCGADRHE